MTNVIKDKLQFIQYYIGDLQVITKGFRPRETPKVGVSEGIHSPEKSAALVASGRAGGGEAAADGGASFKRSARGPGESMARGNMQSSFSQGPGESRASGMQTSRVSRASSSSSKDNF